MEAFVPRGEKLGEGFSKQEILDSTIHPGRQTNPRKGYQSANSWLSDLISLRKTIILCSFCQRNFNPRMFQYRVMFVPDATGRSDGYSVDGFCDWCKGETPLLGGGRAYTPEELYEQLHVDPSIPRRNARAAAKAMGTWNAAQAQLK